MAKNKYFRNGNTFECHTPEGDVLNVNQNFACTHTYRADAQKTLEEKDGTVRCTRNEFWAAYTETVQGHIESFKDKEIEAKPMVHAYSREGGYAA